MSYDLSRIVEAAQKPQPKDTDETWIEEQYWGHRLWDGQSPWLTFLEFFCVAEFAWRKKLLLRREAARYPFSYEAYLRMHLRNIMFNGEQKLAEIAEKNLDSETAWNTWIEWITDKSGGLETDERDFSYLRDRFPDFKAFALLIQALRSCAIEGLSNKAWGSQYMFPFGPNSSFVDVGISSGKATVQYIYFGRSGELLYLMLARSIHASSLAEKLPGRLFQTNKWDKLVGLLQPDNYAEKVVKRGAYTSSFLPYDQHPIFDLIASDWEALLDLSLPGFDVIPYLVTMGAFGLFLYQLNVSAMLVGKTSLTPIVCEVVAPRPSIVRSKSIENLDSNHTLSMEALNAIFDGVEKLEDWNTIGSPTDILERRKRILEERFGSIKDFGTTDPDELWKQFKSGARSRHAAHFGEVHKAFGKGIGLISRRGTNRLRYAPNDAFLKAILYSTVKDRMELGDFLVLIYEKYGLVFGEAQAQKVFSGYDIDLKPFRANTARLEQRLNSLGLVRRLSDACAYVQNPFSTSTNG